MLEHVLREFHGYVLRFRRRSLQDNARGVQFNTEHRMIMEAIREKDADRAERLATTHIQNAYKNMLARGLDEMQEQ